MCLSLLESVFLLLSVLKYGGWRKSTYFFLDQLNTLSVMFYQ